MKEGIFKKHVYDVDIKDCYARYCRGVDMLFNLPNSHDYYKQNLKGIIDYQCKLNNVDFDQVPMIVLDEEDNHQYFIYMALTLLFYEPFKINLFLNYHLKNYKKGKTKFVNAIEFEVLNAVNANSFFNNSERLTIIATWIENKREKIHVEIIDNTTPKLDWRGDKKALRKLSELLYESDYTHKILDFQNVFTNGKITNWRKNYPYLSYLLYRLVQFTPPQIAVINAKGNAYQKVSQMYFLDNGKQVQQKNKIANHISTIRNNAKEPDNKEIVAKTEILLKTAGIIIQKKIVGDSLG